jgi:excisionase family DNA binding protein
VQSRRYVPSLAPGDPVPDYLTRPETAAYLRVSLAFIAQLTAAGDIPSLKVGYRRLYRRSDLDTWMASKAA